MAGGMSLLTFALPGEWPVTQTGWGLCVDVSCGQQTFREPVVVVASGQSSWDVDMRPAQAVMGSQERLCPLCHILCRLQVTFLLLQARSFLGELLQSSHRASRSHLAN